MENEIVNVTYVNYYNNGVSDTDEKINSNVCARKVTSDLKDGSVQYFVKQAGGRFFDPNEINWGNKRLDWKMRKVSLRTFLMYLEFLGHGKKNNLGKLSIKLKAEREQ